jgi:hypothetical protein
MAGYLEEYGVADERRNRIIRWIVIVVAVVGILGVPLYLLHPLFSGWWQVRTFMGDLRRADYHAAYRVWGCSPQPCSGYSFEDFMADWGPKGRFAGAANGSIQKVRPCGGGTIVVVAWPKDSQTLWYQPSDHSLTFWPWGGCPAHFTAPEQAPAP